MSTVKNHVRAIIAKLGASDRTEAAVRAVESGLVAADAATANPTKRSGEPGPARSERAPDPLQQPRRYRIGPC